MSEVGLTAERPALKPERRIWAFTTILVLGSIALWIWMIASGRVTSAPTQRVTISWWVLAILFFAVERWPVSVLLRNNTVNIGLTEVPLVLGLFTAPPLSVGVGYLIGMGAAAITGGGSRPMRTAFNLAQCALFIGLASYAFTAFNALDPREVSGWVAAYASALVLNLTAFTTLLAVRLLEGKLARDTVVETVGLSALGAVVNGGFGLVGAVLLWNDPKELLLTVLPVAALVSLYYSYVTERRRREAVEFLRGAGDAFRATPELEAAIVSVLSGARTAFRASLAQLTIFPNEANEQAYRTTVRAGGDSEVMVPLALIDVDDLLEAESDGIIINRSKGFVMAHDMLVKRNVDDAMVALLRGRDRILGALLVGGHTAAYVDSFDDRDLQIFRNLAVQTAAVLENGHVENAVASLAELQDKLTHQAFHDALTGLANRALFGDEVTSALADDQANQLTTGAILINIDDFADVNETLGHAAGDDILAEAARRISGCVRPHDLVARWGGDEFAILLRSLRDSAEGDIMARRVLTALKDPLGIGTETVRLRASIGIAVAEEATVTADVLIRRVDVAMTAAKAAGKNCAVTYVDGMELATVTRHQVRGELERAIEHDELAIHYQPLVDLADGRIVGSEALLRWWHPERGLIGPGDFIGIAEDSGLIINIGSFVLREACHQTLRWQRRYPTAAEMYVSVNVSTRQLAQPLFVEEVMTCLDEVGFDPKRLVLELTESMLVDHNSPLVGKLQTFRRHGIRIAIDDFGTGYSSLSYLRNLPIDLLKIAKPFVDDLAGDDDHGDLARAIVALGGSLKLKLIAEGIEEQMQLDRLREMGCGYGQGYLLARPIPQGEIDKLLAAGGVVAALDPTLTSGGPAAAADVIQLKRDPA